MEKKFILVWFFTILFGWTIGTLIVSVDKQGALIEILPRVLLMSLVQGAMIGLCIGIGQRLIYKEGIPAKWFNLTVLGYALCKPLGVLMGLSVFGVSYWLESKRFFLLDNPSLFLASSSSVDAIFGGWFIGLTIWMVLRDFTAPKRSIAWLWVIGTWVSVGIGVFVGLYVKSYGESLQLNILINQLLESVTTGGIIGLGTGLLLKIILEKPSTIFQKRA